MDCRQYYYHYYFYYYYHYYVYYYYWLFLKRDSVKATGALERTTCKTLFLSVCDGVCVYICARAYACVSVFVCV